MGNTSIVTMFSAASPPLSRGSYGPRVSLPMPRDFFEIDGRKQYEIMLALLQRLSDSGKPLLEALSDEEGRTPQAIWDDICESSGVEPCKVPDFLLTRGRA
jgi:hypothetical protein